MATERTRSTRPHPSAFFLTSVTEATRKVFRLTQKPPRHPAGNRSHTVELPETDTHKVSPVGARSSYPPPAACAPHCTHPTVNSALLVAWKQQLLGSSGRPVKLLKSSCNWAKELEVTIIVTHFLSPLHIICISIVQCIAKKPLFKCVCARSFTIASWCWVPAGVTAFLFPSSSSSLILFGTGAIWFKWSPLQLASLQLLRFMNCCAVHWKLSHHHLFTLSLPEKFFFFFLSLLLPFAGKLSLPSRGRGLHH